ncbi:hypothetical protein DOTSEDRAFT_74746 [Dothistroma septosporum NZE10]|uniref:Uncharacterized protein n=1 Tax=Dothistroma septosporum (strain NZE10 / CBS 128990) TaxID=675120 RepID=N1PEF7_DOTSN|nr:hypothetical protein DOTSEDRAFT_74746 [Dothistroma septosporum NZE10]
MQRRPGSNQIRRRSKREFKAKLHNYSQQGRRSPHSPGQHIIGRPLSAQPWRTAALVHEI